VQISEMIEKARELISLFEKVEPRVWGVEAMAVELSEEVGSLADSIMVTEGYRPGREGRQIDLEDEIADVIFMLIRIADYYDIDLEQACTRMINRTREKLP
jgi:NTP pyrophosphatase (non-canonical NTP hydrolase)